VGGISGTAERKRLWGRVKIQLWAWLVVDTALSLCSWMMISFELLVADMSDRRRKVYSVEQYLAD